MKIDGLPEGVELVRLGPAGPDDFEMYGDGIRKGQRHDGMMYVIVKPADGWTFEFDIATNKYYPVQKFVTPRKYVITAEVTNNIGERAVREMVERLGKIGLKVSIEESR